MRLHACCCVSRFPGAVSGMCQPHSQPVGGGFREAAGPGEKRGLPHKAHALAAQGP